MLGDRSLLKRKDSDVDDDSERSVKILGSRGYPVVEDGDWLEWGGIQWQWSAQSGMKGDI